MIPEPISYLSSLPRPSSLGRLWYRAPQGVTPSFHHNLRQLRLLLHCLRIIYDDDIQTDYIEINYVP